MRSLAQRAASGSTRSKGTCARSGTSPSSPDGSLLASAGWDRDVRHDSWVLGIAFDPTGDPAGLGELRQSGKDLAPMSGECLRTLEGHVDAVNGLAFSPAGSLMASASSDKSVRLWAAPTNNGEEPR